MLCAHASVCAFIGKGGLEMHTCQQSRLAVKRWLQTIDYVIEVKILHLMASQSVAELNRYLCIAFSYLSVFKAQEHAASLAWYVTLLLPLTVTRPDIPPSK